MEYIVIILFFLLAVLIIVYRVKRFLRELYQSGYKNESEAYKDIPGFEKEKKF
ncbi:MAG: hypothetical protein ABFD18_16655 [Syntrophomonas sp.]